MSGLGDKVKGKVNEATGSVKEEYGRQTGDSDVMAEGQTDQAKGKAQGAMGEVKEAVSDIKEKFKK